MPAFWELNYACIFAKLQIQKVIYNRTKNNLFTYIFKGFIQNTSKLDTFCGKKRITLD